MRKVRSITFLGAWHAFQSRIPHLVVFLLALGVYLFTLEGGISLWDSPEFIAAGSRLEVGHPPGAPFYLLLVRLFALLAPSATTIPIAVNVLSALASAAAVTFLFEVIRLLAQRCFPPNVRSQQILQLFAAAVGALTFAFTDSFWFSAVEAEVYALSTLLTIVVFWAILRWEQNTSNQRWLLLIAYLVGLSIGVHLLCLLALPTVVLVYYFAQYRFSWRSFFVTILASLGVLFFVLYLFMPGVLLLLQASELLFANLLGCAHNVGAAIGLLVLFATLGYLLHFTYRTGRSKWHLRFLMLALLLLGYSSYTLIVVRASAAPPLNLNAPNNVFALADYLSREQYGNRPLFYGQYYSAPITDVQEQESWQTATIGYRRTFHKRVYRYDARFETLFPRMYSSVREHQSAYIFWGNVRGTPLPVAKENGEISTAIRPTFAENLRYAIAYQFNHQYWRYFLWNFVGRQDDVLNQSGSAMHGNVLSGFATLDGLFLGSQRELPNSLRHAFGRTPLYCLPLLLGLLGFGFLFFRSPRYTLILTSLFFMTGLAIVFYLNQTPLQPRERDYTFLGSFMVFSIWIGFGVLALYELLRRGKFAYYFRWSVLLCAEVVLLIFSTNLRWHNRHGRNFAHELALNYLQRLEPNAILFTVGDNDTYPLWYIQEVEGIRRDVRVCNLELLPLAWYINQLRCSAYESAPLPLSPPAEAWRNTGAVLLELLKNNRNERPIYFSAVPKNYVAGIEEYLRYEGFVYKFDTHRTSVDSLGRVGALDPEILYNRIMRHGHFESLENPKILADYHVQQTVRIADIRGMFTRLATALCEKGDSLRAKEVLARSLQVLRGNRFAYDEHTAEQIELLYTLGEQSKADELLGEFLYEQLDLLRYYRSQWTEGLYLPTSPHYLRALRLIERLSRAGEQYGNYNLRTFVTQSRSEWEDEQ